MGNVDDDLAFRFQLADDPEQRVDLRIRQGCSRLVKGDHFQVFPAVGLHDLHHLLIGDGKILDLVGGFHIQTEFINDGLRSAVNLAHFDSSHETGGKTAEENIFTDSQLQHDLPFLIDHADTGGHGLPGAVKVARLSVDQIFTGGLLIVAVEHLQQGRFACAVFAHQRQHLAAVGGKTDVVQSFHTGEIFGDIPKLNYISHFLLPSDLYAASHMTIVSTEIISKRFPDGKSNFCVEKLEILDVLLFLHEIYATFLCIIHNSVVTTEFC